MGRLELEGSGPAEFTDLLQGPKRAALLVYLATARPAGFKRRDTLLALFWPDLDQQRARHALRNTLHSLRKALGQESVCSRGTEEVGLCDGAVWSDAGAFETAVAEERFEDAVELYGGEFLADVHVPDVAPEFGQWVDGERDRLARGYSTALERVAEQREADGDFRGAARCWLQLTAHEWMNSRLVMRLMNSLASAGERARALQEAERYAARMAEEFEAEPEASVMALADELRAGTGVRDATPPPVPPAGPTPPDPGVVTHRREDPDAVKHNPLVSYGIGLAALIIVALGLVLALSRTSRPAGAGTTASTERVVVFPFSVSGTSETAYLGDGMVDLLSTKLDGAGNWRSADPRAVMSAVARDGGGQPRLARGDRMAVDLGADLYVLGNIVEVGGSMFIDATLYRPGQSDDAIATASAEGTSDQVLALIDQLAAGLLQGQAGGSGARLTRLALVTTDSLPALKWYLNGVREFRAARFPEAWAAFSNAVAADTAFALAWYQLSVTADWLLRTDLSPWDAADQAMLFADRLTERDRQLLEAMGSFRRGRFEEAERRYRAILERYPDDVEAWSQLGELLFHLGPSRGRRMASSMEAWRQAVRLEPDRSTAYVHMARVAASISDSAMLDTMSSRVLALVPSGDRSLEMEMLRAFSGSDSASRARASRLMRAASEPTLGQIALVGMTTLPNIDDAIVVGRFMTERNRSTELRAVGHTTLAFLYMAKGHWEQAMAQLDTAASFDPVASLISRTIIELAPFRQPAPATIRSLRAELEAYDATTVPPTVSTITLIALHNDLHEEIQAYLLRLVDGYLSASNPQVSAWGTFEVPAEMGTLLADWQRGELASASWVAGDHAAALQYLETIEFENWYQYIDNSPFVSLARERFLLATLLEEAGRLDEALKWYGTFEDTGPHDRMYIAPSHLGRARIHERLGNLQAAGDHYRAFIALWQDADPEFQPQVQEARKRLGDVLDDER